MTDAAMIRSDKRWPFLPLKRPGQHGVLLANQSWENACKKLPGSKFIIYHVNLFRLPKTKEEWDSAPKSEYDTIEALLADKWVVD